jgi:hypothetical protein
MVTSVQEQRADHRDEVRAHRAQQLEAEPGGDAEDERRHAVGRDAHRHLYDLDHDVVEPLQRTQ